MIEGLLTTIARLDAWLETMRSRHGYTGPVAHWWESCLLYSGPMIDWRYEGIVTGCLTLFERTGESRWLDRAVRAGEDILRGQLATGEFYNSSFQVGPIEGGTPHEAAVDVALLTLAAALRSAGDRRWQRFYCAAERNLQEFHLARLWDGRGFTDQPWNRARVANKNATLMEALLLYESLGSDSMEAYIRAAAEVILATQVVGEDDRAGATVHVGTGAHRLVIPIYTARCACALMMLYNRYPEARYPESARRMGAFLLRSVLPGGTRFGYYRDGRAIACPVWISPSGDVLRALIALQPYMDIPAGMIHSLAHALISAQTDAGGIPTARGLGRKGSTRAFDGLPDFRDLLPVAGWCDKTFRALALLVEPGAQIPDVPVREARLDCTWKARPCFYEETNTTIRLTERRIHRGGRSPVRYEWRKGEVYPRAYDL
jgi:hypothetical protein